MERGSNKNKQFWTVKEVVELFEFEEAFITDLEEEEIICPTCRKDAKIKGFSSSELEKLRLAKMLIEEMEVNVPGVGIILHMRQNMIDMRRQFDAILKDLAQQLQKTP